MMHEYDTAYALERESQERIAADTAVYPGARAIHLRMARRYADQADAKPQTLEPRKDSAGGRAVKQNN